MRSLNIMKRAAGLGLFALGLLLGTLALTPATTDAQRRGRRPRVIQLDEIRIEGRVQKPNAFYILNRSNLGYEVMDLRTSFVREVIRSVQTDPF
ncbi:MAG: hypothetical protein DRJ42_26805 [Deltaproteobacteria bacterium]|nr:MAG: hypothetical protein DRJ42_26805 [Deltaproteobacteria bacterium]